jgi:hypothetical protein
LLQRPRRNISANPPPSFRPCGGFRGIGKHTITSHNNESSIKNNKSLTIKHFIILSSFFLMLKLENSNANDSDLKPAAALEVVAEDRQKDADHTSRDGSVRLFRPGSMDRLKLHTR